LENAVLQTLLDTNTSTTSSYLDIFLLPVIDNQDNAAVGHFQTDGLSLVHQLVHLPFFEL